MFDNCNTWLGPILWFIGAFLLGYLLRFFLKNRDKEQVEALQKENERLAASLKQEKGEPTPVETPSTNVTALEEQIREYENQIDELQSDIALLRNQNADLQSQAASANEGEFATGEMVVQDDLKRIEGIGPRVEKILNKAGIVTWTELAATPASRLREILDAEGGRFQYLDPTSWPQQAMLAKEGKWQELEALQQELIGGVYYGPPGTYTDTDDLKRIEGVGPRVEGLLNQSGIHTWKQLAQYDPAEIKKILETAGGRYRNINPASWPRQASLAAAGEWEELDKLQEELIGGEYPEGAGVDTEKEDLKIIEGLGVQAEKTLNRAGINTYEALAQQSPIKLRQILDREGDRYINLDPTSWPQQAMLAAAGRWDDLHTLQDELISGLYVGPSHAQYGGDDLKRIEGIGPRIEGLLNHAGINSFEALARTDIAKLQEILAAAGHPYDHIDPTPWVNQAQLATEEKWDKLDKVQNEMILDTYATIGDDLKRIEGIGPKIEAMLKEEGITTFQELAKTEPKQLKEILDKGGDRYRIHNPGTWPEQAALAVAGKWEELDRLQEELIGGLRLRNEKDDLKVIEGISPKVEALLAAENIITWKTLSETDPQRLREILNQAGDQYRFVDPYSWPEQARLAHEGKWEALSEIQQQLYAGAFASTQVDDAPDDLKRIEGVGPKIEDLLNEAGIFTFTQLANTSVDALKAILNAAGDKYRIHDPSTWPQQAALAADRRWKELDKLQVELIGGKAKSPAVLAATSRDDLKIVEGIGPKIEGLLNDAGIHTWKQLANTQVERLKQILVDAGDRYRIHNPGTWPRQAGLAAEGKWDELNTLQEELIGGRES